MNEQIKKFYSNKSLAQLMGKRYAEQEKQDVFLHESNISQNQFEYSLRFRSEIIDPESSNILRHWQYTPSNQLVVVTQNKARRSATGYDNNLPSGLGEDPGDTPETKTCPTCEGDSAKQDGAYCSTCECAGELTEAGYPAHIN